MQLLANEHLRKNGDLDDILKIPKKSLPFYLSAYKLKNAFEKQLKKTLLNNFRVIQAETCMPEVDQTEIFSSNDERRAFKTPYL